MQSTFEALKIWFSSLSVLAFPHFDKPFRVDTEAASNAPAPVQAKKKENGE